MPRKSKIRVRKYKKQSRKPKQTRKTKRRIYKRGGTGDKVNCCMCGKEFDKSDTLIPQVCLIKNGQKAHRICYNCWWNPETGFARENAPHGCPGCAKQLPLTNVPYKEPEMVDLTLDDD
jgi:hypothetical protein